MPNARFPALSVRQPFADLITRGDKNVENRTQRTHFRGAILIHASGAKLAEDTRLEVQREYRKVGALKAKEEYRPSYGALVGIVDIVDCVTSSESESSLRSHLFDSPAGELGRYVAPNAFDP